MTTRAEHHAQIAVAGESNARATEIARTALSRSQDETHGVLDAMLVGRERRRDEGYRIVRSRMLSGQVESAGRVAPALQAASHDAAHAGLSSLTAFGRTVPNPDAIAARVAARMADAQATTLGRLAAEHGRVIERTLAEANRLRVPAREAAVMVNDAVRQQAWQLERIAVTEASFAFNAARQEAFTEWHRTERGLYKRWTERISDTGKPFDNKVAFDSQAMHAQVMRPDAMFRMPEDNKVDSKWWWREWEWPPSRPHDRAVMTPWTRGSRTPAWTWNGNSKVSIR